LNSFFSNAKTLTLAKKAQHTDRKTVSMFKVKQVVLENKDKKLVGPKSVNIDGEMVAPSPCKVTVLPRVVKVLCPF
jgi:diacylglycerol kinase family enzyme